MQQNTNRRVVAVVLIFVAIPLIGILLGILYAQLPSHNPQGSQAGCESVGGDWDTVASTCFISYKQAGESCTDGGQCVSGICSPPILTNEERATLAHDPISDIVGVCTSDTEVTGCVPQVLKGTVSTESMCED